MDRKGTPVVPDLIVIGGGMVGLAIARAATIEGLSVTIVDPEPGSGASGVAAGMLAPITELHYGEETLLRLNLASARAYPEWINAVESSTGLDTGYRPSGTLLVARDRDDNEALGDLLSFQRELGLEVKRLSASETRQIEPALAPSTRGGILVPGDHQVDPPALIDALVADCELKGVTFERARCRGLAIEDGRCTGLELEGGARLSADKVVLAAGARSSEIPGVPMADVPVRPVKGQLLHLRAVDDPIPITHNVRGAEVYMVPRGDGRLVIGATVEERGHDTTVTTDAVHRLLRDAYELVPGITEMVFEAPAAGIRPGTPDNAPLIGPTSVDGLAVATGHYRNGVLLAPITATAIVGWLTEGQLPGYAVPFAPARFRHEEMRAR